MEQIVPILTKYGYFILFPMAVLEGPLVSLAAGFLVYLGYFQFFSAYGILLLGDIIPDVICYYIGRFGNKKKLIEKHSSGSGFILRNLPLVRNLWQNHGKKTMFLSKLAYSLRIPFLISAGLVEMPFRKFISYAVPVSLFQYGVIMTVGYLLGHSYQLAGRYIQYTYNIMAAILMLFIVSYIFISKYARRQIEIIEREEQLI